MTIGNDKERKFQRGEVDSVCLYNKIAMSLIAKEICWRSTSSETLVLEMTLSSDEQIFFDAIEVANIPTLLMVLVQLTGELEWLEAPYTPKRQPGLGDNDTGGLEPQHQREVRDAALEAILAWRAGRDVAIPEPKDELLYRMLSLSIAESVHAEEE